MLRLQNKIMATVLISFIGTGSRSGSQYDLTEYFFKDETNPREVAIFGSALLQHLKDNGQNVEKRLILGTEKSIWSELIKMFPELLSDDKRTLTDKNYESQRESLEDEAIYCQSDKDHQSKISQDKLDAWEKIITDNLANTEVKCRKVGYAADSVSNNAIFREILDSVNDKDRVVFDVTHGLRHQPIITSSVIMYLRYLKNITDVEFYYGAKDLDGKVIKLDFCNELLKATEAVAIFEQTGNYEQIGKQLKMTNGFDTDISKALFADEMHKADKETPSRIIEKLEQTNFDNKPLNESLANFLKKALSWARNDSFAERLKEKAENAFKNGQYFKAIASLWEGLGVASCDVAKKNEHGNQIDPNDFKQRNWAVKRREGYRLQEDNDNQLKNVEHLRNTVLHGSVDKKEKIQEATEDLSKFEKIFKGGLVVFEKNYCI